MRANLIGMPVSVILLFGSLLLSACGGGDTAGDAGDAAVQPIKVGAIFDLSGPTADVGTIYAEGIRGYVDWLNAKGGVYDRPVELLYQDYGYKVDVAEQLYSEFVQSGVVAFMGWGTGDTEALRGRIADDHVPFMSASYSHLLGNPAEAPYNFLAGTSYSDQLFIVLDWIAETSGGRAPRVALMHAASPFGLSPYEQGGREYAAGHDIELTPYEMSRGATDFTAELGRIAQSGARYVVFQNTSGPVALALKNARALGLKLTFVCLNWCTNEVLTELAGPAAEGVVGSVIFSPPGDGVAGLADAQAYLESKGSSLAAKGLLYGQGWWTIAIMTEGIRRAAAGGTISGESIKTALESLDGFATGGTSAPVSYSANDHWGIDGMRLFKVTNGRWQVLTDLRQALRK